MASALTGPTRQGGRVPKPLMRVRTSGAQVPVEMDQPEEGVPLVTVT